MAIGVADMDYKVDIQFNKEKHEYRHNGQLLVGVSTICEQLSKDFMAPWAVKEMEIYLKEEWKCGEKYTQKQRDELLKIGKRQWREKSDKAKVSGTLAHTFIDDFVAGKNPSRPDDPLACNAIDAFLKWNEKVKPKWLANELIVGNIETGFSYAGTLDFIAEWDGKTYLGDFKTSSQISESYFIQTALYQYALEKDGQKVDGRFLLRLDKTTGEYEECYVYTPFAFDLEIGKALYNIHKWRGFINNRK